MKPRRVDDAAVIAAYQAGVPVKAIRHCAKGVVFKVLARNNIPVNRQRQDWVPEAATLRRQGLPYRAIGERFGKTGGAVLYALRRAAQREDG